MGLWGWLFGKPEATPQETWTLKRFVRHVITCCTCKRGFTDGEIILQSNMGRFKHRGC